MEDSKTENGAPTGEGNEVDEVLEGNPEPRKLPLLETESDGVGAPLRSQDVGSEVPVVNGESGTLETRSSSQSPQDLAQEEDSPEDQDDSPSPRDAELPNTAPSNSKSEIEVETRARLDALASERAALQVEVAQLRRSLEEIQERHEEEVTGVRENLAAARAEKEHAETQYHNLLGKVNTIKSQLGERLKADAVRTRFGSFTNRLIPY